jgi:bifunctional non-homologous end joining protein LigD
MLKLANLKSMLLDERSLALNEPGWLWELKFDGYRLLARFGDGKCELRMRRGADATWWFPEVAQSLTIVPGGPHTTDGEVCVLDGIGCSDFERLHHRARRRCWYPGADQVTYCVFDLLQGGGKSLMALPLLKRKARMMKRMASLPFILPMSHADSKHSHELFEMTQQLELEGRVAKKVDSVYRPGVRSGDWVKVKPKGAVPAERFRR